MPGGVAVGRNAGHAAVAKEIMLAIDELQLMAEIEVFPVVAIFADEFGIAARFPFEALHHQFCIGQIRIAANMIEVQMRIDQVIDSRGIDAVCAKPPAELLAGAEENLEDLA